MKILLCVLSAFLVLLPLCLSQTKQSCYSPIYCQGDLLHVVQLSGVFNDSKTFVDMAMVNSVNETLKQFRTMMLETNSTPSRQNIVEFVSKNFVSIGEIEEIIPKDFKPQPKLVKEIPDPVVRKFASTLVGIWPSLTRIVSYRVKNHPGRHSIIPVDNPFIVPGGRFKEFYYWDTYWVNKGLLLSEMYETTKGIIENLMSMVERYGFIPNGGRIYYLNRSQPPLLTLMVKDYVQYTRDFPFLREHIGTLDKELHFWLDKRSVEISKNGVNYRLARYDSDSDTPRPEAYKEDIETCSRHDEDARYECYTDLKSGAESGWDFSARWIFEQDGEIGHNLHLINTRRNVPVDLNAFLYKAFVAMYNFNLILEKHEDAQFWLDKANDWKEAIEQIMYHEEDGTWYDWDLKLGKHRRAFFASNIVPLWARAIDEDKLQERATKTINYLDRVGILKFRAGIPSSIKETGLQWDFPNAWSPYQNMIIISLWRAGDEATKDIAVELAHKWVNTNIRAYHDNKVMFEKYSALNSGQFGGGGEYIVQAGFGWSNGCILELIDLFFRTKTRKHKGGFH